MGEPFCEQIRVLGAGNYSYLSELFDKKQVIPMPWVNTQVLTVSGVNSKLIPSSILSGTLAVGNSSTNSNGGIFSVSSSGFSAGTSTGSASDYSSDGLGSILNLVDIRDSSSNDPILDSDGRKVWGLIQSANGVADGASIAANPNENLQISFVVVNSSNVLTLVNVTATIEFQINKLYSLRYEPTLKKVGSVPLVDIVKVDPTLLSTRIVVTTGFIANEVMTIGVAGVGNATGATAGVGDVSGATLALPSNATNFNSDGRVSVYRNGLFQDKGTGLEVIWDSSNSLHFTAPLNVSDVIVIKFPQSY